MPVQDTMMRGGTRLRKIITDYLSNSMPYAIDLMIAQNNDLSSTRLPLPAIYDSVDPTTADQYPYVGCYVTGTPTLTHSQILPTGSVSVTMAYDVTMFVATSTLQLGVDEVGLPLYDSPYKESALRVRDDLIAVMLNCLVNSPTLGTARTDQDAYLDVSTINTSFPEPVKRGNDANPVWLCSGMITCSVSFTENAVVAYWGNANTFDTEIDNVL